MILISIAYIANPQHSHILKTTKRNRMSHKIRILGFILSISFGMFQSSTSHPLVITGLGSAGMNRHFVEVYSTEQIKDLSYFTFLTEVQESLPNISVPAYTFVMFKSKEYNTSTVYNCSYEYTFGSRSREYIFLNQGDDTVTLLNRDGNVIDKFGGDICNTTDSCNYLHGWAARQSCYQPSEDFNLSSWNIRKGSYDENVLYPCMRYINMCGMYSF